MMELDMGAQYERGVLSKSSARWYPRSMREEKRAVMHILYALFRIVAQKLPECTLAGAEELKRVPDLAQFPTWGLLDNLTLVEMVSDPTLTKFDVYPTRDQQYKIHTVYEIRVPEAAPFEWKFFQYYRALPVVLFAAAGITVPGDADGEEFNGWRTNFAAAVSVKWFSGVEIFREENRLKFLQKFMHRCSYGTAKCSEMIAMISGIIGLFPDKGADAARLGLIARYLDDSTCGRYGY